MKDPQPILNALADPTRRAVFERLNRNGPASASQLALELPVTRQAISKHLGVLDSAGLVSKQAKGREVLFSAQVAPLGDVADWLEEAGTAWDARLERLRRSFD